MREPPWRALPLCTAGRRSGVIIAGGWTKTLIFIVVAPVMGFVMGFGMMVASRGSSSARSPRQVDKLFRKLQLLSAAAYSLGHGGNDAQKTMGIVAGALYTAGIMTQGRFRRELGTLALAYHSGRQYGHRAWHILRRVAHRAHHGIEDHKAGPVGGFCAETAGAITLFGTALAGIPVSTTHTITGAIVGVGSTQRLSAVRWGVARRIVWAWVLTIPASAAVAALAFWIIRLINPNA